jgi:Phosphoribosylformimino-5-aminoimidazole carboxamide ribonucleotide (ProFAR) isomerase
MPAATGFEILPAIDLRGGRVVRLRQGDFARETAYSDDPAAIARAFTSAGARWLHVVDLDGARTGSPVNGSAIQEILLAVGDRARVEVAGGLRTSESVGAALSGGAARVVIGTAALQAPEFIAALLGAHGPDRICIALDVRDGMALGEGWRDGAPGITVETAMALLADAGASLFEVTSIERDGGLGGPDLALYQRLVGAARGPVIASGGIANLKDIVALRKLGCAGAIVGRALLDGSLDLADAISASGREE